MTGKERDLTVPFLAMFNNQNYYRMKQYYVNVEGEVFALVKKEVAKCIFKKDKGMTVFLIFPNGDMDAATKKRDIRRHDGAFGIRIGTLRDFLAERKVLFPNLKSIAMYYQMHGKFPWGIKSIITSHGWYNRPEAGCRQVIVNEAGNEILRLKTDGAIKLDCIKAEF